MNTGTATAPLSAATAELAKSTMTAKVWRWLTTRPMAAWRVEMRSNNATSAARLGGRRRAVVALATALLAAGLAVSSVAAQTSRSGGLNTIVFSGATHCYNGQNTFTREPIKQIIVEPPVIRSTVLPARFAHAIWTVRLVAINENGSVSPLSTRSTYGSWQFTGAGHQYTFINTLSPLAISPASWRGTILMQETIQLTNAAGTPLAGGTTTVWEDEYYTDTYTLSHPFSSEAGYCVFR